MASPRREKLDERLARLLREQRESLIRGSTGASHPCLLAPIEYEDFYVADGPPGPEPGTDHQPAFGEPWVNDFGDDAWSASDPYWIRVLEPGLYRISLEASATWDFDFSPDADDALVTDFYSEAWRSHDPDGLWPEGRDDPFNGALIWSGFFGSAYDQRCWDARLSGSKGFAFSGTLTALDELYSLRVIWRLQEIALTGGDWFSTSFQGAINIEKAAPLPEGIL